MSAGCMIGDMEHMPCTPDLDGQRGDPAPVESAPSPQLDPVARRRSLVGALGSLTSAHRHALTFVEYGRTRKRYAWESAAEHREAIARSADRAAGFLARIVAIRAELDATRPTTCAARCRDGHACRAPRVRGRRRCKLHGGLSTGPRTDEGKARALAALAFVHARRRQQVTAALAA